MAEDIKKVLKMVEEGKLSREEGARLIEAVTEREEEGKRRFLRILVEDGAERVKMRFPLTLFKWAARFIPKDKGVIQINEKGMDLSLQEILDSLEKAPQDILSIDTEDGTRVKIWIE